jgi:hypothetical protein
MGFFCGETCLLFTKLMQKLSRKEFEGSRFKHLLLPLLGFGSRMRKVDFLSIWDRFSKPKPFKL